MLGKLKANSIAGRGYFYVPGITRDDGLFVTDRKGYLFTEFFKRLEAEKDFMGHHYDLVRLAKQHPDRAVETYIRDFDMVVIMVDHEGTKFCYSVNYMNKLPAALITQVRTYLRILPDDTILWSDSMFRDPQPYPAREVIFGQRASQPPTQRRKTQREVEQDWTSVGELSPDEMDYLTGKSKTPPTNRSS